MNARIDPHSSVPPSQQLVATVLDAISAGELSAGDKLPSVRGLAASALVNPNTVTKAYRDLEHLGATEGRNGSGVYVTERGPDVAKGIRLAETLAGFAAAARFARRAGHGVAVLEEMLRQVCREGERDGDGERRAAPQASKQGRGSKL